MIARVRLSGWQRIGVVLSLLWVVFVCGYSVYEYVRAERGTQYFIEMVRADGKPFSHPPSFEDFVQKPRIKLGLLFSAIVLPPAAAWAITWLFAVTFRWVAAGFRKNGS